MSQSLESRFTLTADPEEIVRRLRAAGELNESLVSGAESSPPPSEPPAAVAPKPDRAANGQFAKGNAGGPGNPFGRRAAALRRTLLSRLTDEDMAIAADAVIEQAKRGDLVAFKLVLQYTVGKPLAGTDPDRIDVDEMSLLQEEKAGNCVAKELVGAPPLQSLLELVRMFQEEADKKLRQQVLVEVTEAGRRDEVRARRAARRQERQAHAEAGQAEPVTAPNPAAAVSPDPIAASEPGVATVVASQQLAAKDDTETHAAESRAASPPSTNGSNGAEKATHAESSTGVAQDGAPQSRPSRCSGGATPPPRDTQGRFIKKQIQAPSPNGTNGAAKPADEAAPSPNGTNG